jgi:hypothetical protein
MPKHTPTQFYFVNTNDGMKLRSGKRINCFSTTEFGREAEELLELTSLSEIAEEDNSSFVGSDWYEFLHNERSIYGTPITIDTVKRVAGGLFSPKCTRIIAFERFVAKWRSFINTEFTVRFRDTVCKKLEEGIKTLHSIEKNGYEQFCGCGDRTRAYEDDITWDYYMGLGPGFLQENEEGVLDWVLTPEVSHEEFEERYYETAEVWRHDRLDLRERLETHLAYFNRVPHKFHQDVFFALSSKSTPSACAKHILSFL